MDITIPYLTKEKSPTRTLQIKNNKTMHYLFRLNHNAETLQTFMTCEQAIKMAHDILNHEANKLLEK